MLMEKLLDGIISDSDYQDHAFSINKQMQEAESRIERLKETDSGIDDFIPLGISLLTNLKDVFDKVSIETKHQLLSSILAEKLELNGEKYRTPVFKEGFSLIYESISQLQDKKPKTGDRIAAISRLVPRAGLEPARPKAQPPEDCVSTNFTTWVEVLDCSKSGRRSYVLKRRGADIFRHVDRSFLQTFPAANDVDSVVDSTRL
jgi:hypothetical protein